MLGGHTWRCIRCGHEKIAYNACRNRHCPKCQASARAKWLSNRTEDLLPVEYSHVVFTVPQLVADIALQNKKVVYSILMRASAETLKEAAANPKNLGAQIGFLSVLHTWNQKMLHHPHVHCVVPAGGISPEGDRWVSCPPGFFLPVKVLARLFRGKFLDMTKRAFDCGDLEFQSTLSSLNDPDNFAASLRQLYNTDWVVYSKPPFGNSLLVYKYLAGYTHRVAISNHRLVSMSNDRIRFRWRDSAKGSRKRVMEIDGVEFTRRFLLHVLPKRFMRIRHYGLLGNRTRAEALARCRELIDQEHQAASDSPVKPATAQPFDSCVRCPVCKTGQMIIAARLPPIREVPVLDSS